MKLIWEALTKNWGLKLLSLALALIIYHSLKPRGTNGPQPNGDSGERRLLIRHD